MNTITSQTDKTPADNEAIVAAASGKPVTAIDSVVLRRLMEEVKWENPGGPLAYNRTHNRHNRGR